MSDHRQGVVTDNAPLMVRFDGDSADVIALHLGSYTPTIGDRVVMGRWGSQWVVLGEVVVTEEST